ncbi:Esterase B1 [Eumeta japonica]|uniref:Esterase B1 n=1 Tax=Eumeta variegata TaxID=151549 RepID=A0A4C1WFL4_EUMVA|nr:Esterase B1 [Eumeta japonica]
MAAYLFRAPEPPLPWDGTRSAKEHGPICHQFDSTSMTLKPGSEDCLYLNVYTPSLGQSSLLPVMVWIHGGAFMCGSGNDDFYGPDFLIEKEIILVTFNYRLEAVGFLCLDNENVPGNAGMKDQVAVLRWVHKNIKRLGGDPENVTIFGHSAGAASVCYHLVSPMTKGLFKRAIVQSGSMHCHWAQCIEPRERALAIARGLGYEGTNDEDLYEFYKNVSIECLVSTHKPITMADSVCVDVELACSVVSEKQFENIERFFYGNVYERLREGIHDNVEILVGYTAEEAAIFVSIIEGHIEKTYNNYLESFAPALVRRYCKISDQLEVGRKMKNYYFGKDQVNINNAINIIDYYSMAFFVFGTIQFIKFQAKRKVNKTYLYKFNCRLDRNFMTKHFKPSNVASVDKPVAAHTDELAYLFPIKEAKLPLNQNSQSFSVIQNMTKLWTDFAKFGNPTPDESLGVKWSPYSLELEDYLEVIAFERKHRFLIKRRRCVVRNDLLTPSHSKEAAR